jgi:hypothetical protein
MSLYDRDPSLPYWRANIDIESLFEAHGHRRERAQAWLSYRHVSGVCPAFELAVVMRGTFEAGILGDHTYTWTFTPTYKGDLAIVLPVYQDWRLVDCIAIYRHDVRIWGCITGAGQCAGEIVNPLRVCHTLDDWLTNNCAGVLPLAKNFLPLLQVMPSIIANDFEHAWDLAERIFIQPAARFGLDCSTAEQMAFDRISFQDAS